MKLCLRALVYSLLLTPGTLLANLILLSDFNGTGFDFTFSSWSGQVTTGPAFVTIGGTATESGGAGTFLGSEQTVSTSDYLTVTARLVAGNQANKFQVILRDIDGAPGVQDEWAYNFDAALFNTSTFTTVSLPIASPSFNNSGTGNGIIDFDPSGNGGLARFSIQGDHSSSDAFAVEFDHLAIVPEPSAGFLLITGLGALSIAGLRRLRAKQPV